MVLLQELLPELENTTFQLADQPYASLFNIYQKEFLDISVSKGLIHSDALAIAGDGTPVQFFHFFVPRIIFTCQSSSPEFSWHDHSRFREIMSFYFIYPHLHFSKIKTFVPFEGIGKPEPLKENLSGYWSRHIDDTNRLVYSISDDIIEVVSCRDHY